ncbi:MAG: ribonuclease Z [Thermomicrobiales bacterium]
MIDFLLLGTGAMMPLPDRWLSSLLVRSGRDLILFDCGEGTQIPWRTHHWGFRSLSSICLTHWHADHVAGLPGLLHTVANAGRTEPLRIFGPVETERVVAGLRAIAPDLPFAVEVGELRGGDRFTLPGALGGRVLDGDHRVPCLLYRVDLGRAPRFLVERARELAVPQSDWGRLQAGGTVMVGGCAITSADVMGPERPGVSFGLITDSRPVPGAAGFFHGVDLLVSEGTYGDSADGWKAVRNKHMTFAEAAQIAADARAKALWLTHFSPAMARPEDFLAEATDRFANTTVGTAGLTTTLRFADD